MGFRFRRSVRILPGIRLNFSRSGVSATVGKRGISMTVGPKGTHVNAGIPGTGLSYRQRIDAHRDDGAANIQACPECSAIISPGATVCPNCSFPFCLLPTNKVEKSFGKKFWMTLFVVIFIGMAATLYAVRFEGSQDRESKDKLYSPAHQAVLSHFKSGEEKKVIDAVWTSDDIFKIGMVNDGTSHNGYAEYACNIMYDNGFRGKEVWVQIVDIGVLNRSGKWVKIGEAHCR